MLVPFVHAEEVPSATPHPVTTQKDPPLIISEKDFVSIVIVESESVRLQKLDVLISEQGIKNAESIFEPYLEFGYGLDYGFEQNNTEQAVVRSSRAEFEQRDNIYSAAISGLLPTGAEYKMFYDLDDPSNSLQSDMEYGHEYRAKAGVELKQPLLRDFGIDITKSKIKVAEKEQAIAKEQFDKVRMQTAYMATMNYADLQLAQARLTLEKTALKQEQESADIISRLATEGRVSKLYLFQIKTNIARRKARVSFAQKLFRRASSSVRQMLIGSGSQTLGIVQAVDQLPKISMPTDMPEPDFESALRCRPEYLEAKLRCELEDIRLNYAKNQRLPDLDLRASFGKTGLETDWSDANDKLNGSHKFWSVDIKLSIPLQGGTEAKSTLMAAKMRKQQASITLKTLETLVKDEIVTARDELESTFHEVERLKDVVETQENMLTEETKKYKHGTISRTDILAREIELTQAQIFLVGKKVDYHKALLSLKLAEGKLLDMFDLNTES
jgi:outer membrane protein